MSPIVLVPELGEELVDPPSMMILGDTSHIFANQVRAHQLVVHGELDDVVIERAIIIGSHRILEDMADVCQVLSIG